ncbi:MAG TPA: metal-sulfur cluster assembly factor [Mycobacteriales bacterium]|nr:metal-sulfur cluster assembly factor [Mycobacteriales bacterium]
MDASHPAPLGIADWCAPALTADLVLAALHDVIDPELGVNIVDLGLLYDVRVDEGRDVSIRMTLTTPGCPLGGYLDDEIQTCLRQFHAIRAVEMQLVWEPPWSPELMTPAAKEQLGWRS